MGGKNDWRLKHDDLILNLSFKFSEVTKGCAGLAKKDGCKESKDYDAEAKKGVLTCYCQGDFCNSAGSFQVYPVLIASLILASLLT